MQKRPTNTKRMVGARRRQHSTNTYTHIHTHIHTLTHSQMGLACFGDVSNSDVGVLA